MKFSIDYTGIAEQRLLTFIVDEFSFDFISLWLQPELVPKDQNWRKILGEIEARRKKRN